MEDLLRIGFFSLVALSLLWVSATGRRLRRRRRVVERVARKLDLEYRPERASFDLSQFHRFTLTRGFELGYAFNTMVGRLEIAGRTYHVRLGDCRAANHKGQEVNHPFSYALVTLPFPFVPDVLVGPERIRHQLAAAIGFEDIDFESAAFSRRYVVAAPHKRFAYDLIHPQMMEFLLQVAAPTIYLHNRCCVLTDGIRLWTPDQFARMAWWTRRFLELWPPHLLAQLEVTEERTP